MAIKWISVKDVKNLNYYEHETRMYKKHRDRYFATFYRLDGKTKCEAFGWESDGWEIEKIAATLHELRQNRKTGEGPRTLAEKRRITKDKKEAEEAKKKEEENESLILDKLFEMYIEPYKNKVHRKTWTNTIHVYNTLYKPKLGSKPINEITTLELQSIINQYSDKVTPATLLTFKAIIRQIFFFAKEHNLYFQTNPALKVHTPDFDNKRTRFLTEEEVDRLLTELKENDRQAHDMALLSVFTGARASEVLSLRWENVDLKNNMVTFIETKSKNKTRHVPLPKPAQEMLKLLNKDSNQGFVFKNREGKPLYRIPDIFEKAIYKLELNKGIEDTRQKAVFHTLRHTYASRLVMRGADLYSVQKLLGHYRPEMTQRYSHLAPEHLKKTASLLDG
ncbi:MAG: site-specific integrase [Holosporaceae bacterium]|jgi:integrase|nr:site-specific integrase [Holosporaceae bacterium]